MNDFAQIGQYLENRLARNVPQVFAIFLQDASQDAGKDDDDVFHGSFVSHNSP
jgi:hypothetical protein